MADLWPDLFRPPLGWPATVLIVAMAAAAAVALYRGGAGGPLQRIGWLTLRLLAVAALAWLLSGPSRRVAGEPHGATAARVVVLADTSRSMAEMDVTHGGQTLSRWEAVRSHWLEGPRLASLRERASVEVRAFDERPRPWPGDDKSAVEPDGRATHLFDALDQLARQPQAGAAVALLLTDGHDTQVGSDPTMGRRLRDAGWRVFAVPVGSRLDSPDLAVHAWAEADRLFDGQTTTIHAQVSRRGFERHRVAVDLVHEGVLADTRTLDGGQRVAFEVTPGVEPGRTTTIHGYEVVVRAIDDDAPRERITDNNRRHVFIEVTRQKLRVVLFEGEPYWDTRFLARHLRQDPQVDIVTHVRVGRDRELVMRGDANSMTDDTPRLDAFDVVVLGRGVEAFFPGERAQELVDYVHQGGALVLARGRAFTNDAVAARLLAEIEPVAWGEQVVRTLRVRLTEGGAASPLLAEIAPQVDAAVTRLPDLIAATVVREQRAASVVLLEQSPRDGGVPAMAAVAHQRVGRGRVFAVLGDGLWRWAFTPSSLSEHESVYALFWSRAIRWLAAGGEFLPGQDWSLQLSTHAADPGETVMVTASSRYPEQDATARVEVVGPDGERRAVAMSPRLPGSPVFDGVFTPEQPGVHAVTLQLPDDVALSARLGVYDRSIELIDTSARPEVLKALAQETGGACLALDDDAALLQWLDDAGVASAQPDRIVDAARPAVVMAIVLGALGLEWALRRRAGLV
jgi:hypothetical protein